MDPQLDARMTHSGIPNYAPAAASPAVDAIPVGACNDAGNFSASLDALGGKRRGAGNTGCDIGAVEMAGLPILAVGFDNDRDQSLARR